MAKDLETYGMSETVRFEIDERGLTVRLVSADTFFSPGSADLTEEAGAVLQIVGPVLAPTPYEIQVEGNADYKSTVGSRFPTNWELSSSRATAVLRYLVEHSGLTEHRIAAVGFGSARPLAAGRTPRRSPPTGASTSWSCPRSPRPCERSSPRSSVARSPRRTSRRRSRLSVRPSRARRRPRPRPADPPAASPGGSGRVLAAARSCRLHAGPAGVQALRRPPA